MHDAQDPFRHRTTTERGALIRRIALTIRQRPGATPRELVRHHLPELAALNFETTQATNATLTALTKLEESGLTRRTPSAKKGQPATWEWIGGDAEPPTDEAAPAATIFADIAARVTPASQVAWKREEPALAVDERTKDGETATPPEGLDEANAIRFEEGGIGFGTRVSASGPAMLHEMAAAIKKRAAGYVGLRGEKPDGDGVAAPDPQQASDRAALCDRMAEAIITKAILGRSASPGDDDLDDVADLAHLRNDVAMLGDHLATLSERVGQLIEQKEEAPGQDGIRIHVRLPGLTLDLAADTDGLSLREMRLMHNLLGSLSDAHGEDLL